MNVEGGATLADTGDLLEERELRAAVLQSAYEDLARPKHRASALQWFLAEDREWPYAFLRLCDALGLDAGSLRDAAIAQHAQESAATPQGVTMAGPVSRSYVCKRCDASFDHTFPKGGGRAPSYCMTCRDTPKRDAAAPASTKLKPTKKQAKPAPARSGPLAGVLAELAERREKHVAALAQIDAALATLRALDGGAF